MTRGVKQDDERDRGWFPEVVPAPFAQLTKRERQITFYLAHGLFPSEIAPLIGSMVKTVDSHRLNAMRKLGTTNSVHLARLAIKAGFVTSHGPDEPCACGRAVEVSASSAAITYVRSNGGA